MIQLVTAFFAIPSKQPPEFYLKNAKNLLACPEKITLFTSPQLVKLFLDLRGHLPLTIVSLEVGEDGLPQLPIKSVLSENEWTVAAKKISCRHGLPNFSVPLLQLYLSKAWFVERAIEIGSLHDLYIWVDIGSVRCSQHQQNIVQWPCIKKLLDKAQNKLTFYQRNEAPERVTKDMDFDSVVTGSPIFGLSSAWKNFHSDISSKVREHYNIFQDGIIDETIYFALISTYPDKYQMIRVYWGDKRNGGWFETFDIDLN